MSQPTKPTVNQPTPEVEPTTPPQAGQPEGIVFTQQQIQEIENALAAIQKENEELKASRLQEQAENEKFRKDIAGVFGVKTAEEGPDFGKMTPVEFAAYMENQQKQSVATAVEEIKKDIQNSLKEREVVDERRSAMSQAAKSIATERGLSDEDIARAEGLVLAINSSLSELSKNMGADGDPEKLQEAYKSVLEIAFSLQSMGIDVDGGKLVQKQIDDKNKKDAISRLAPPSGVTSQNIGEITRGLKGKDINTIVQTLLGK